MTATLDIRHVAKSFVLHAQGGLRMPVFEDVSLRLAPGAVVALTGPSGSGKSSLMRMIYGNYACDRGEILVRQGADFVDVASADARLILALRRTTMGYISQFLRVLPRVPALTIVMEPMLAAGMGDAEARARAKILLERLDIPERLWPLSPVTFSGGEQQRINIARGLGPAYALLLLDEPTASLDAANRRVVLEMIGEARDAGAAILAILHDDSAREVLGAAEFRMGPRRQ